MYRNIELRCTVSKFRYIKMSNFALLSEDPTIKKSNFATSYRISIHQNIELRYIVSKVSIYRNIELPYRVKKSISRNIQFRYIVHIELRYKIVATPRLALHTPDILLVDFLCRFEMNDFFSHTSNKLIVHAWITRYLFRLPIDMVSNTI